MIDLSTGKPMTRREAVKGLAGLAGIIAAGKAPAAVVRSMLGARGVAFGGVDNFIDGAYLSYVDSGSAKYISSDYVLTSNTSIFVHCLLHGSGGGEIFGRVADGSTFRVGGLLGGEYLFFQISPKYQDGSVRLQVADDDTIIGFGNYPNAFISNSIRGTSVSFDRSNYVNPKNVKFELVSSNIFEIKKLYTIDIYDSGVIQRQYHAYKRGDFIGMKCRLTGHEAEFTGWSFNV